MRHVMRTLACSDRCHRIRRRCCHSRCWISRLPLLQFKIIMNYVWKNKYIYIYYFHYTWVWLMETRRIHTPKMKRTQNATETKLKNTERRKKIHSVQLNSFGCWSCGRCQASMYYINYTFFVVFCDLVHYLDSKNISKRNMFHVRTAWRATNIYGLRERKQKKTSKIIGTSNYKFNLMWRNRELQKWLLNSWDLWWMHRVNITIDIWAAIISNFISHATHMIQFSFEPCVHCSDLAARTIIWVFFSIVW